MMTLPGGMQAYVTGSASSGRAVVVASDIFGIHSGRTKAICDELAAEGFLVVLPDFFKGVFPDEGTSPPWWKLLLQAPGLTTPLSTPWSAVSDNFQQSILPFLASQGLAAGRAALLGFCWGAWVVIRGCGDFPDQFACGMSAHPSVHNIVGVRGEKEVELVEKVKAPQLVLASKDEPAGWKPGGAVEEQLRAKGIGGSVFKEFGNMKHGWVPRGDLQDPTTAAEVARALEYMKGFLGKHLPR